MSTMVTELVVRAASRREVRATRMTKYQVGCEDQSKAIQYLDLSLYLTMPKSRFLEKIRCVSCLFNAPSISDCRLINPHFLFFWL